MEKTYRQILYLTCFVAAAGCMAHQADVVMPEDSTLHDIQPKDSAVHRIHSKVIFIDHQRQTVDIDNFPKGLTLVFAVVPGQINGTSQGKVVQMVPGMIGSEFQLDLDGMTGKILDRSTVMLDNQYTQGLSVIPPATMFSRLGTLAVDVSTGKSVGWTSFMDSESRDSLLLIYVDRRCSMTGTVQASGERYEYDIQLNSPGFHWIRSFKLADHSFLFKGHAVSGDVYFSIQNRDQIM